MSKNIVIVILAILCVGFFFYGLIQNIEAKKQTELAHAQTKISIECSQQVQQKDKELADRNQQLMLALNAAREAKEIEQRNLEKAQKLYEMTQKQGEQANAPKK
ncbi:MAG: hypothetical protein ACKO1F_01690 [Flammeovirgaceae bacterium]